MHIKYNLSIYVIIFKYISAFCNTVSDHVQEHLNMKSILEPN